MKPRLPPSPTLSWKSDGTPVADAVGDVYFSVEDGLAEAQAVFLAGCGLPERWQGQTQFTIAELGFGTGLNFLAAWQMWRENRPSANARLDFVSFEGFPLTREDAARALSRWPELAVYADALLANWPVRMRGVQRIAFADGVSLTLHVDEITDALPRARFRADAWFLDGFAPAKNEAMWADKLYTDIFRCSKHGARIGTYTVAGAVRRGLAGAGFEVRKLPGFGRKRERLEAVREREGVAEPDVYGLVPLDEPPKSLAIIGAGIAGACLARRCIDAGLDVSVFEQSEKVGAGASGNALALVMPRLDTGDTMIARTALEAYLSAQNFYRGRAGVTGIDALQRPRNQADVEKFSKLVAAPPLDSYYLSTDGNDGLIHRHALLIEPAILLAELFNGARLHLSKPARIDIAGRTVNGNRFDAIVLANGLGCLALEEASWLPLTGRLGQVEYVQMPSKERFAIASGHYALAHENMRLWGASFEASEGGEPKVSAPARRANMDAIERLGLGVWAHSSDIRSRAGVRATTPDKLPVCGILPDFEVARGRLAEVRKGRSATIDMPRHEGLFVLGGLGSRGFGFAPLMADVLLSLLCATPLPTEHDVASGLSPVRFLLRGLKRGQF